VPELGRRVQGRGSSRRRAEQEAAERMLTEIGTLGSASSPT
jgi:dsRNA-specific ribonuclease